MSKTLPHDFAAQVGFDVIRQQLASACGTPEAEELALQLQAFGEFSQLQTVHAQLAEALAAQQAGKGLPAIQVENPGPLLPLVRVEGSALPGEDLLALRQLCRTWDLVCQFAANRNVPQLQRIVSGSDLPTGLAAPLERALESDGTISPAARPELARLRQKINATQQRARQVLNTLAKASRKAGHSPEDAEPTVRNGRLALPILAEHKRHVKGMHWGSSATGQTTYIEPQEVVELNNAVADMADEERQLIHQILVELTDVFRPHREALQRAHHALVELDLVRAKAHLAAQLGAVVPPMEPTPALVLKEARHPVLVLQHGTKDTVAFSLTLDGDQRMLLISGPNAGGKSVTMTAVVLCQYMAQAGLATTVGDGSKLGFYGTFALAMGDAQSLENDLSTYSSHLRLMRQVVDQARPDMLLGVDEFGSGTEPQLGGALAQAMLERLLEAGVQGVITTHYAALKQFAHEQRGIVNGGMRYDATALKPTFQLQVGLPGSSYALEIARTMGLGEGLIERATELVGSQQSSLEQLLVRLEQAELKARKETRQAEQQRQGLAEARREYEELKDFLDKSRKQEIRKARQEAKHIVDEANKRVEETIRQIKESKAEKQQTAQARQQLEKHRKALAEKEGTKPGKKLPPQLQEGSMVLLDGQGTPGEVLSVKGKEALVRFGQLTSYVKLNRLTLAPGAAQPKVDQGRGGTASLRLQRAWSFRPELDLRGQRAEAALLELERYVDQAVAGNATGTLRVLHGKGNGVLRELSRHYLNDRSEVAHFEDAHPDQGGAGVTLFQLKP